MAFRSSAVEELSEVHLFKYAVTPVTILYLYLYIYISTYIVI
jgi:hypothetical protein